MQIKEIDVVLPQQVVIIDFNIFLLPCKTVVSGTI